MIEKSSHNKKDINKIPNFFTLFLVLFSIIFIYSIIVYQDNYIRLPYFTYFRYTDLTEYKYPNVEIDNNYIEKISQKKHELQKTLNANSIELVPIDAESGTIYKAPKKSNRWILYLEDGDNENPQLNDLLLILSSKNNINLMRINWALDIKIEKENSTDYIKDLYNNKEVYNTEIRKSISHLIKTDPNAQIFIYGNNLGGSLALLLELNDLSKNVKGIIEDGALINLYENVLFEFSYNYNDQVFFPKLVIPFINVFTKNIEGYRICDNTILNSLKKSNIPTLFIHAKDSIISNKETADKLLNTNKTNNKVFLVNDSLDNLDNIYNLGYEKYWEVIYSFMNEKTK